jgi:hypothetical protein
MLLIEDKASLTSKEVDRTSKEADKVSREMRLTSKEAGMEGNERKRRWKGKEKEEGAEAPSSHGNQRDECIWRRENGENNNKWILFF